MAWTLLDSGVAGFADGGAGHAYTFPLGAATAGNLLILAVSSDTTVSTPSGWSVATSDVHNIGAYSFYKVASGGEASATITTSGNFPTEIGYARYSGATGTPLDVTAKAFSTTSTNVTPSATAVLTGSGELVIAAACLGGLGGGTPNTPVWSAGYTNRLNGQTSGTGVTDQHLFVADRYDGTGSQSPSCSWTSNAGNQTLLVAAFKPAGGRTFTVGTAGAVETARPIGKAKRRALGVAVETDQARPLGKAKRRALGIAAVIAAARPIGRRKTRAVGSAGDVQAARPIGRRKTRAVGSAGEVSAAQHLGRFKRRTLALAVAVETARQIGRRKTRAIHPALVIDTARPLGGILPAIRELPDLTASVTYTGRIEGVAAMSYLAASATYTGRIDGAVAMSHLAASATSIGQPTARL